METSYVITMITFGRYWDLDWPIGKYPMLWEEVKNLLRLDDNVAMMNMDQDLCKFKLMNKKDPKILLDNIVMIKVQYGCELITRKKTVVFTRSGKGLIITIKGITSWVANNRGATAEEFVAEIHKQCQILGGINKDGDGDGDGDGDDDIKETVMGSKYDIVW